jgi:integrase/recombinase XerD
MKELKIEARAKTYLTPDQVKQLEEAATNLRDRLLIRILFHLGCRISEALAISVDDVDFSSGTITIKHLKRRIRYSCPQCNTRLAARHRYCPGCGAERTSAQRNELEHHRQRMLPVDEETIKMLKEYIERGGPVLRDKKRLIFGINRNRSWQIVKECAEKAELPKIINPETGKVHNVSPHRLRDAFAVHAVKLDDSGDGLRLLQEHLGHQSFNTTAKYRKVAGEEHREWYQRLWGKETNGGAASQA